MLSILEGNFSDSAPLLTDFNDTDLRISHTVLLVKFKKCLLYQEELTFVNFCGQQKYENVKVQIEVFQKLHF